VFKSSDGIDVIQKEEVTGRCGSAWREEWVDVLVDDIHHAKAEVEDVHSDELIRGLPTRSCLVFQERWLR